MGLLGGLALGSTVLSGLFGGKKEKQTPEQGGFNALPKAVQDAWLNVAMPKIMATADRPYQSTPMQRVSAPTDIFGGQGIYDLQKYSDSVGGYLNSLARPGAQMAAQPQQAAPQLSQQDFTALLKAIDPNFGMTNPSGQMIGRQPFQNQERQRMAIESAFKKYGGR